MRYVILAGAVMAGLWGCGTFSSAGAMRASSRGEEAAWMPLGATTRVFDSADPTSAEFFLSDLPPEVWTGGADVSGMSGVMVHVHLFLCPRTGRTPIATDATTATIRVLVLSNGELGVFGGGGFFTESGDLDGSNAGGSIRDATVRLMRATPGFEDRLGPAFADGSISAPRDAAQVKAMRRAFNHLAGFAAPVE